MSDSASDFPVVVVEHIKRPRSEQHLLRTRNRIIDLVIRGKRSREWAEKWGRQRGLEPFQSEPDVSRFDPMTEADWTLAMATAWILKRTPAAVRAAWAKFACECWDWHRFEGVVPNRFEPGSMLHLVGWKPEQRAAPTPWSVLARGRENREGLVTTPEEAEDKLRNALRQGELVARHGRKAEPIDKHLWGAGRLSPFASPRVRGSHDAVYDDDGEVAFKGVTVERDAVIALWERRPEDTPPIAAEARETGGAAATSIRQAAINAFAESLEGRWPQTKLYPHLKKTMTDLKPPVRWDEAKIASKHLQNPIGVGHHGPRVKGMKSDKSDI